MSSSSKAAAGADNAGTTDLTLAMQSYAQKVPFDLDPAVFDVAPRVNSDAVMSNDECKRKLAEMFQVMRAPGDKAVRTLLINAILLDHVLNGSSPYRDYSNVTFTVADREFPGSKFAEVFVGNIRRFLRAFADETVGLLKKLVGDEKEKYMVHAEQMGLPKELYMYAFDAAEYSTQMTRDTRELIIKKKRNIIRESATPSADVQKRAANESRGGEQTDYSY